MCHQKRGSNVRVSGIGEKVLQPVDLGRFLTPAGIAWYLIRKLTSARLHYPPQYLYHPNLNQPMIVDDVQWPGLQNSLPDSG